MRHNVSKLCSVFYACCFVGLVQTRLFSNLQHYTSRQSDHTWSVPFSGQCLIFHRGSYCKNPPRPGAHCTMGAADIGRQGSFTVSVTHNVQNTSIFSYTPKPVLKRLGNPKRITFTIHGGHITVAGPDDQQQSTTCPNFAR